MVNCFGVWAPWWWSPPRRLCWRLNVSWLLFITIILCLYYAPVAEVSDWLTVNIIHCIMHKTALSRRRIAGWRPSDIPGRQGGLHAMRAPQEVATSTPWRMRSLWSSHYYTVHGAHCSRYSGCAGRRWLWELETAEDVLEALSWLDLRDGAERGPRGASADPLSLPAFCVEEVPHWTEDGMKEGLLASQNTPKRWWPRCPKQKHSKSHFKSFSENNAKGFLLLGTPTGDR